MAGESDISNASRPIKDGEAEECGAIDRNPIEFRVGTDALAVTVSAGNYFAAAIDAPGGVLRLDAAKAAPWSCVLAR